MRPTQMVVSRKSPCYLLNPKDEKQMKQSQHVTTKFRPVFIQHGQTVPQTAVTIKSSQKFLRMLFSWLRKLLACTACRCMSMTFFWIMLSCCSIESSPGLANLHTSGDAHRQSQQLVFPGAKQIETTSTESTAQDHPLSAK